MWHNFYFSLRHHEFWEIIEILKVAYNYEEQGKPVVLLTSRLDDRDEVGYISSRIGMRRKAYPIGNDTDIFDYIDDISPRPYCVFD